MVKAPVRFGVIGLGNMGAPHSKWIREQEKSSPQPKVALTAVCDRAPEKTRKLAEEYQVPGFHDADSLIRSGKVDAVLIAVPHYDHPTLAIAALEAGLHVLCEKPMAVNVSACDRMLAAAHKSGKALGMMFQNRTNPTSQALKKVIAEGRTGNTLRVTYTRTDWLRTKAYYQSSDWRATWKGEGGGILMNQAPHDLDLICWLVGKPKRVTAFCRTLRHAIEVEDFAAGLIEFENGAIGFFQSTTAETPGRNQFEIVGDQGTVAMENGKVTFTPVHSEAGAGDLHKDGKEAPTHPSDVMTIINTSPHSFPWIKRQPAEEIPLPPTGGTHLEVTLNFAEHILEGKPLIAPATNGFWATELANAFYLSSATGKPVDVPVDRAAADEFFRSRGGPV